MQSTTLSLLAVFLAASLFAISFVPGSAGAQPVAVIPKPAELTPGPGAFVLNKDAALAVSANDPAAAEVARYLADTLAPATGFTLPIREAQPSDGTATVVLTTHGADPSLGDEGYDLTVTDARITLKAPTAAGLFYGVQSLRQLLPPGIESSSTQSVTWSVPAVHIVDKPRYAWRGFMLDCSRHFMTVDFIKRYLDLMAYHKLNRFHWHFTDSNGWRLQIDKYPNLTDVGAAREWGVPSRPPVFYTKADVREVLAYAKARHIMVIPEIEMPGHSAAALAAYPELKCAGSEHAYCAGTEAVFPFLQDVLAETIDLFDAPYVHLGGDERPKGAWEKCPRCQARQKELGLASAHEMQTWFMRRMTDFVASKGKRAITWAVTHSDPYHPTDMADIGNNAIIQNWHGGTAFAAERGWDVVNSANGPVYFDYPQFAVEKADKPKWMPLLPLEKVYAFDPTPAGLTPEQAKHIWGTEACLWTEFVPQDKVDYQVFPRLSAFAEVAWSPRESKDFADFTTRLQSLEKRLSLRGVQFAKSPTTKPTTAPAAK
jgi:hexosaminidase